MCGEMRSFCENATKSERLSRKHTRRLCNHLMLMRDEFIQKSLNSKWCKLRCGFEEFSNFALSGAEWKFECEIAAWIDWANIIGEIRIEEVRVLLKFISSLPKAESAKYDADWEKKIQLNFLIFSSNSFPSTSHSIWAHHHRLSGGKKSNKSRKKVKFTFFSIETQRAERSKSGEFMEIFIFEGRNNGSSFIHISPSIRARPSREREKIFRDDFTIQIYE